MESAPKKGRRAGLGFFGSSTKDTGNQEENNDKEFMSSTFKEIRSFGWADETTKSVRLKSQENLSKHESILNQSTVKDFDDGIPVIPNLEDVADEEFVAKIAKAPQIGVNRVATYKELENDLLKHTAFANLEEVNLRILTHYLNPEPALHEPDEPWTKESLLSHVISVMNDDKEGDTY